MNINQTDDKTIKVDQLSYAATIKQLHYAKHKSDRSPLTSTERSQFRAIVGQLNWLACVTRPDVSFDVCQLSATAQNATVADAKLLNKVVKKVHADQVSIVFPKLDLDNLKLLCFSDASFANLPQQGSQGGNIILLTDGTRSAPLQWSSNRIKRVVRSTLAAETLSLISCCDSAVYLKSLIESTLNTSNCSIAIECIVDNKSLYENIHSVKPALEQRLRIDIAALREMVSKHELEVTWKDKRHQLADCLTKRGASCVSILKCVQAGVIPSVTI